MGAIKKQARGIDGIELRIEVVEPDPQIDGVGKTMLVPELIEAERFASIDVGSDLPSPE